MSTVSVSAVSHDREFRGTLTARGDVELEFRRLAYENYDDGELAAQLAELAERLTAGCREGQKRAAIAAGLEVEEEAHWHAAERRFREERDRLPVSATSPAGDITLSCEGLRNWRVRLKPGATRRLSEAEFAAQVRYAALAMWMQHRREVALLRHRYREVLPG